MYHSRRNSLARVEGRHVQRRRLGADRLRIDRVLLALDHAAVDAVLHVGRIVGDAPQAFRVRLVLGEQEGGAPWQ
jgi:hypothetical protein